MWSEAHSVSESGTEEVEAVTLSELLNLAEGVTLVKMDIEGAEVEVLRETWRHWNTEKIVAISVEAHSNTDVLMNLLDSMGFKVQVYNYRIDVDLVHYWIKAKPKPYTLPIAIYRLIASTLAKPTVTIVKGVKK